MSEKPELGQLMFGNPTGDYGTKPFADALVDGLLNEIGRVFWNVNQKEWDRFEDPKIPGLTYHPYYWGDDETESKKPNLAFDFSPQEIRWYKHPGRGQSCTLEWTPTEWADWYEKALNLICKADIDT